MKVKELIAALQQQDPEAQAIMFCAHTFMGVDNVEAVDASPCKMEANYYDVSLDAEDRRQAAERLIRAVIIS